MATQPTKRQRYVQGLWDRIHAQKREMDALTSTCTQQATTIRVMGDKYTRLSHEYDSMARAVIEQAGELGHPLHRLASRVIRAGRVLLAQLRALRGR